MLNKEVIKEGILDLLNVFTNWNIDIEDVRTMRKWYSFLHKMTDMNFKEMVAHYILEERFNAIIDGLVQFKEEEQNEAKTVELGEMAEYMYGDMLSEGDKK